MHLSYSEDNNLIITGVSDTMNRSLRELYVGCSGCTNTRHSIRGVVVLGAMAILNWHFTTTGSVTQTFDISVFTDLRIGGDDSPQCQGVNYGFWAGTLPWMLQFIVNGASPLYHGPVPRWWYGSYTALSSNLYTQRSSWSTYSGDSAMSISLPNARLVPGSSIDLSIMVRWGLGSNYAPLLELTSAPRVAYLDADSWVSGTISQYQNEACYLILVIDESPALTGADRILRLGDFTDYIPISDGIVGVGMHTISWFAVTDLGTLSEPWNYTLEVRPGTPPPSATRSVSPRPTATPDTRMPQWQIGSIAAAAIIVAMLVTGRLIFSCCNFLGKPTYYGSDSGSSSGGGTEAHV
jgi:hypothetical protein